MVGRFGRGGLIKKAFGGIMEGLADGGIGGGNILSHVAQSIAGGGDSGYTSRAVPGALDFGDNVVTPGSGDFANALDDDNPRPAKRPNLGTTPGGVGATSAMGAVGSVNADGSWGDYTFGGGGPTMYDAPIGPQPNPNYLGGTGGTGGGHSGCSCSTKRYSCEEKCAYNAQMKEKCKGCKTYFRKNKNYIYPKRKRYTKRRSYTPKRRYTRRRY